MRKVSIITAIVMALTLMTASVALAGPDGPTCFDVFGTEEGELIANHGQHIIGDYVRGTGRVGQAWPPNGTVGGGGGAVLPGGPAAGVDGHFDGGVAPGASFCTGSNSPGIHL